MGIISVKESSSDYWAVGVLARIIGGSFDSRLKKEVRVKRGLAYSVDGMFLWNNLSPGYFLAYAETENASTKDSISASAGNSGKRTEATARNSSMCSAAC